MYTRQYEVFQNAAQTPSTVPFVTIGTVVDTNDPQQMGRIRVVCSQWGDPWGSNVEDLPWAIYMSPFGGQVQVGSRGPGIQETEGGVAYGMWAIPKVGSQVAVLCIDGNPMTRMYFGCIYDQFTPHTMPHGRFMYDDHPELEKAGDDPAPYGPYSSSEKFIQPLADNLKQAFGHKSEANYEFRSRAADYSVSRIDVSQLNQTYSRVQDDKDVKHGDWTSTQGYQVSRTDPHAPSSYTDRNYDSMVYSFSTPGFHAFSMDDRQENCRLRFRTTSGHQIILDDTNERIYIATAKGNNWIELDMDGNIDIFSANKVNIRSSSEINMTSDKSIRMYAKEGIHMHSDDEIRLDAAKDMSLKSAQNIRQHAAQSMFLQGDTNVNVKAGSVLNLESGAATNAKAGAAVNVESGAAMNLKSGADMLISGGGSTNVSGSAVVLSGGSIDLNGPSASPADSAGSADDAAEQAALWTNRVPDHEPWARTMTADDSSHTPEFGYDDPSVGKVERGRNIDRGMYWRR
jgi:hypothetical protein